MVDRLNDLLQKGLNTLGTVVDSTGAIIRTGDSSITALDNALRGQAPPPAPEQAFQNIMAHLRSMREMARGGYASTPPVAQKAREIIAMVNQVEPPWSLKPSNIRTQDDIRRIAIRDLQSAQALRRLATGQGSPADINGLLSWMDQVDGKTKSYPLSPAPEIRSENTPAAGVPGMGNLPAKHRGVSTEATIIHQNNELRKHMLLLEAHLQQGCKIGGVACDCCEKHPIVIQGLAEEAIGMLNKPVYAQIIQWCQKVLPMTTADASASGKYDTLYPNLAIELRQIRKAIDL